MRLIHLGAVAAVGARMAGTSLFQKNSCKSLPIGQGEQTGDQPLSQVTKTCRAHTFIVLSPLCAGEPAVNSLRNTATIAVSGKSCAAVATTAAATGTDRESKAHLHHPQLDLCHDMNLSTTENGGSDYGYYSFPFSTTTKGTDAISGPYGGKTKTTSRNVATIATTRSTQTTSSRAKTTTTPAILTLTSISVVEATKTVTLAPDSSPYGLASTITTVPPGSNSTVQPALASSTSASSISGLTNPPAAESETSPKAVPRPSNMGSDGGRAISSTSGSLSMLVTGTSLLSVALAFLVAA